MGHFRFRRSIVNKFLRLNIGKTGFSITGGVPGAHVNMDLSSRRKKPFMNTVGLPGTGLSYRSSPYGPEVEVQRRSMAETTANIARGSVTANDIPTIAVMFIIGDVIIYWAFGFSLINYFTGWPL